MTKKIKCANCGEEKDNDSEEFFKYMRKTYCYTCLEDYFNDELSNLYFDRFIEEECEVLR